MNICYIQQVFMTRLDAIKCTMNVICYETQIISSKYELYVCLLTSSVLENKRFPLNSIIQLSNKPKQKWRGIPDSLTGNISCWVFLWMLSTRAIFWSLEFFRRRYQIHFLPLAQLYYGNLNIKNRNITR